MFMMYVILTLIAAFVAALSMMVQKRALGKIKKFSVREVLSSKVWMGGLALAGISFLLYIEAMKTGPISIIQPLLNTTAPIAVVLSYFMLKESMTKNEGLGIAMIVLGIIILSGVVL